MAGLPPPVPRGGSVTIHLHHLLQPGDSASLTDLTPRSLPIRSKSIALEDGLTADELLRACKTLFGISVSAFVWRDTIVAPSFVVRQWHSLENEDFYLLPTPKAVLDASPAQLQRSDSETSQDRALSKGIPPSSRKKMKDSLLRLLRSDSAAAQRIATELESDCFKCARSVEEYAVLWQRVISDLVATLPEDIEFGLSGAGAVIQHVRSSLNQQDLKESSLEKAQLLRNKSYELETPAFQSSLHLSAIAQQKAAEKPAPKFEEKYSGSTSDETHDIINVLLNPSQTHLDAIKQARNAFAFNSLTVTGIFQHLTQMYPAESKLSVSQCVDAVKRGHGDLASAQPLFAGFDRLFRYLSNDGQIERSELVAALSPLCEGSRDSKLAVSATLFDSNYDGQLSAVELDRFLFALVRGVFAFAYHETIPLSIIQVTRTKLIDPAVAACFAHSAKPATAAVTMDHFRDFLDSCPTYLPFLDLLDPVAASIPTAPSETKTAAKSSSPATKSAEDRIPSFFTAASLAQRQISSESQKSTGLRRESNPRLSQLLRDLAPTLDEEEVEDDEDEAAHAALDRVHRATVERAASGDDEDEDEEEEVQPNGKRTQTHEDTESDSTCRSPSLASSAYVAIPGATPARSPRASAAPSPQLQPVRRTHNSAPVAASDGSRFVIKSASTVADTAAADELLTLLKDEGQAQLEEQLHARPTRPLGRAPSAMDVLSKRMASRAATLRQSRDQDRFAINIQPPTPSNNKSPSANGKKAESKTPVKSKASDDESDVADPPPHAASISEDGEDEADVDGWVLSRLSHTAATAPSPVSALRSGSTEPFQALNRPAQGDVTFSVSGSQSLVFPKRDLDALLQLKKMTGLASWTPDEVIAHVQQYCHQNLMDRGGFEGSVLQLPAVQAISKSQQASISSTLTAMFDFFDFKLSGVVSALAPAATLLVLCGGTVESKLRALFDLATSNLNDTSLSKDQLRDFTTNLYRGVVCFALSKLVDAGRLELTVVDAALKECAGWFTEAAGIEFRTWFVWCQTKPPCMAWLSVLEPDRLTTASAAPSTPSKATSNAAGSRTAPQPARTQPLSSASTAQTPAASVHKSASRLSQTSRKSNASVSFTPSGVGPHAPDLKIAMRLPTPYPARIVSTGPSAAEQSPAFRFIKDVTAAQEYRASQSPSKPNGQTPSGAYKAAPGVARAVSFSSEPDEKDLSLSFDFGSSAKPSVAVQVSTSEEHLNSYGHAPLSHSHASKARPPYPPSPAKAAGVQSSSAPATIATRPALSVSARLQRLQQMLSEKRDSVSGQSGGSVGQLEALQKFLGGHVASRNELLQFRSRTGRVQLQYTLKDIKDLIYVRKTFKLSDIDVNELPNHFGALATDNFLTVEQFIQGVVSLPPIASLSIIQQRTLLEFMAPFFGSFDLSGTGQAPVAAIVAGFAFLASGNLSEKMASAFMAFDGDQDGRLSKSELLSLFGAVYCGLAYASSAPLMPSGSVSASATPVHTRTHSDSFASSEAKKTVSEAVRSVWRFHELHESGGDRSDSISWYQLRAWLNDYESAGYVNSAHNGVQWLGLWSLDSVPESFA